MLFSEGYVQLHNTPLRSDGVIGIRSSPGSEFVALCLVVFFLVLPSALTSEAASALTSDLTFASGEAISAAFLSELVDLFWISLHLFGLRYAPGPLLGAADVFALVDIISIGSW